MRNQGIGSWPNRRRRMTPSSTAIIDADGERTFAELDGRVTRLGHGLMSLGIGKGDRVAYLGGNHATFVETVFAAAAVGAVSVPLNVRLSSAEIGYILDDCGADVLIWGQEMAALVAELAASNPSLRAVAAGGDEYEQMILASDGEPLDVPVSLTDVWMIMYTSGTTGRPKGATLSHGNVSWNTFNVLIDVDVSHSEVALVNAPLFHTAALDELFLPTFIKGGTSVLASGFEPDQTFDLIEDHGVTWVFGVPAMFATLAQHPRWLDADLSSLRTVMCGGAPIPPSLIRTYQERGLTFVQGYGMTETAPGALFLRAEESIAKAGSAGTPCFFADVRIVDQAGSPVAVGEPGEIQIQGPNVMAGYWRRPDADAEAFDGEWFRSGDAGIEDADGYISVVDRIKDVIISGGENVYPAEIERVLVEHPVVSECAVIAVPDQRWGEVGRAVVVANGPIEPQALLDFLSERIARYKVPKSVVFAEALPRSGSGKVLRRELRKRYGADRPSSQIRA